MNEFYYLSDKWKQNKVRKIPVDNINCYLGGYHNFNKTKGKYVNSQCPGDRTFNVGNEYVFDTNQEALTDIKKRRFEHNEKLEKKITKTIRLLKKYKHDLEKMCCV